METAHYSGTKMRAPFIAIMILSVFALSCNNRPEVTDSAQNSRHAELRETLKQRLGDKYDEPVGAATPAQLQRGRALFDQICAPCHGHRGDGEGVNNDALVYKPADLSDPGNARFLSEQARLYIIRQGIDGTAMMSWKNILSEDDILSVYLYTRSLIKE